MRVGIYPGSFDPFTLGHMGILKRASALFDKVIVAVLNNTSKEPCFSPTERLNQIEKAVGEEGLQNVSCECFEGLLVQFALSRGVSHIIRGLRTAGDFEHELELDSINRRLAPGIDTIYLMAEPEYSFIRSGLVKEICSLGGPIDGLIPDINKNSIIQRLSNSVHSRKERL